MPKSTKDIAHEVLHELINRAPYGSGNLAVMINQYREFLNKIDQYNTVVRDSNSKFKYSYYTQQAKQQKAKLVNEINDLAKELLIRFNPIKHCFQNNPAYINLNYQGRYQDWYQNAFQRAYNDETRKSTHLEVRKVLAESSRQLIEKDTAYEQLEAGFLIDRLRDYVFYELIQKTRTGTCGELAYAGVYFLLTGTEYEGSIHHIGGNNVDHNFIVIGVEALPKNFTLNELVQNYPEARIIDPWLRCEFPAKNAFAYYDILNALRDSFGNEPHKFYVKHSLSAEGLAQAREIYQKIDLKSLLENEIEKIAAIAMSSSKNKSKSQS